MGDFLHTAVPHQSGMLTCRGPIILCIPHLHLEPSDTADGDSTDNYASDRRNSGHHDPAILWSSYSLPDSKGHC